MRFDPNGGGVRPDYPRTPLVARLVGVMRLAVPDRGLVLIPLVSRCIRRHDVHELILTDEQAGPGGTVQNVAYLGFAEFLAGGVVLAGDLVQVAGEAVGSIAGFDETHAPNHLNIVVHAADCRPGLSRGHRLGDEVIVQPVYSPPAAG